MLPSFAPPAHDDRKYATFRHLFEEGYLDKRFNFDKPHIRGYVFTITLVTKVENREATFTVNADSEQPEGFGATGKNFYNTDAESGICFSKVGSATAADEAL